VLVPPGTAKPEVLPIALENLMSTASANDTDLKPGETRKVSFAQILVYELRVRDAMTSRRLPPRPPIPCARFNT